MKKYFLLGLILISFSLNLKATHILGGDLLYEHVTGNTYKVTLTIYGDCAGGAFPYLANSSPEISVYNGTSFYTNMTLSLQGPGVNVTPVCPQFASNTQCDNASSTIPGVTRYIYSANVTLNAQSTGWRFRFEGSMPTPTVPGHTAGRSGSITNIVITGVSGGTMTLEAKLNNLSFGNNSSPNYTTVPTPFFCLNQPSSFNPGAVDPNGDSLAFGLVDALIPNGTESYITGYTGAAPLSATGVTFNSSNGQYTFTPNIVQTSVVVNEVKEYKNGILVGTSMREMNFIVQNNCSNTPPTGGIGTPSGGTVVTSTFFRTCPAPNTISFSIPSTDPNGDTVNITYSGIPAGAISSVTNNNTTTATFNFSWNLASAIPGTIYTIFVTYTDYGCPLAAKQTIAYSIYVLPTPDFTFNVITPPTCYSKTVFELTPYRNQSPYDIDITQGTTTVKTYSNVSTTVTDSLDPGTYTLTMTDNYGCLLDTFLIIDPPPEIFPVISNLQSPICYNDTTGAFTAIGTNGVAPYTYSFDGSAYTSTNSFSNIPAGTYTLSIRDANLCQKDTTITFVNPPDIMLSTVFQKPPCNSFQNGSITVTASNAVAPYTYAFNGGPFSTQNQFTNQFSGQYPVIVKDALGCEKEFIVTLPDSIKIEATLSITDILCHGDTSAMVTVNAMNAFPPYEYSMNGGTPQTSNVLGPLEAGMHTILVTDTEGCYWDTMITIAQPDSMVFSDSTVNPLCSYSSDGSVIVTVMGGTAPYMYSANGGPNQTSNTLTGLPNGTHTIIVTDDNGCIDSFTTTLQSPPPITASFVIDSTTCPGTPDGGFTVTGGGGVSPYTYSIGGAYQASGTFTGLPSGAYTVYVKDSNDCILDTTINIYDPQITPSIWTLDPLCHGDSTGWIAVAATGGLPGYTYSLSFTGPYVTADTFKNLPGGTFTVYIKDQNNCVKDTTVDLIDPNEILINTTFKEPPCNSFQNGEVTVVAYNSQAPYQYSLDANPFQASGFFPNLYSGPYTITVQNALGCEQDFPIILPDSIRIAATLDIVHNPCFGDTLGTVTINATSGFPAYTYYKDMDPPQTSNIISPLPAGTYDIHIRDTKDCFWDSTIVITEPDSIQILDSTVRLSCYQAGDGEVYFTILGGTAPYTYSVDGAPYVPTNSFTGLDGGGHSISILDSNNCYQEDSFFVFEPDSLYLDMVVDSPSCYGLADGTVTLTAVGGTAPFTFSLNGGPYQASPIFSGLAAGTYTFSVIDTYGCFADSIVIIGQPDSISIDVWVINSTCETLGDGKVGIIATGGTPPFGYNVDGGAYQIDSVITNLAAGPHVFGVIDDNGCTNDTTLTIIDSFVLTADIFQSDALCNGLGSAWVSMEGAGGTPQYLYAINGSGYTVQDTFFNLFAGTHTLSMKDTNGCIFDTSTIVFQPTVLGITAASSPTNCTGQSSGTITAIGTGGTAPYSYSIDGVNFQSSGVFNNLPANSYTVTVMDTNGCTHDTVITLIQPLPLQLLLESEPPLCNGASDATITAIVTQGTAPYNYALDGGPLQTSNVFTTSAGSHIVVVTDANSCQVSATIVIQDPAPVGMTLEIDSPTCEGYLDGQIRVLAYGGVGNYEYAMNGSAFTSIGLYQNLPVNNYTISVRDSNGCTFDTSFVVTGLPGVTFNSINIDGESCYDYKDGQITLDVSGTPPYLYHLRNYIEGDTVNQFTDLETGWYTVTVEDSNGCTRDTNLYVPTPDPYSVDIEVELNDCNLVENEAFIQANSTGGTPNYSYRWSNGSTGDRIENLENGDYIVYAQDVNGCADSAFAKITFDNCCNPFLPNAFTPNGDGQNDYYQFYYNGDVVLKSFQIFNRYGQKVFETENLNARWDGTVNGKLADVGVYHYRIFFICGNLGDNVIEETGDLTLIR